MHVMNTLHLNNNKIFTSPNIRNKLTQELKQYLLAREYPERIIDSAIERTSKIPRHIAVRKSKAKTKNKKTSFCFTLQSPTPGNRQHTV